MASNVENHLITCFNRNGEIFYLNWNDNRCDTIANNHDNIEPLFQASNWNRKVKERLIIPQPRFLKNYNFYIGVVDQHDWRVTKYSKKWYRHFSVG